MDTFKSEKMHYNNDSTRSSNGKTCYDRIVENIDRQKREQENKQRSEKLYGENRNINIIGMNDRLSCVSFNEQSYTDSNLDSYEKGYIDRANDQLLIAVSRRMSERSLIAFLGEEKGTYNSKKYNFSTWQEHADSLTKDFLYKIGFNDGSEGIIDFDELPEAIKNNSNYVEGYEDAIRNLKKGR